MEIYFQAILMGAVEGLTEFLPVSSTGHLILVGDLLNFFQGEKRVFFEIFIQLGAILAICWLYRQKLITSLLGIKTKPEAQKFFLHLFLAFLPAAFMGLLFAKTIKSHFFFPLPVAFAFFFGAIVMLWVEQKKMEKKGKISQMTWKTALSIGLFQCFALIPGISRSGATIIGGLFCGLSRKESVEFSFFLAIPTLFAASFYELFHQLPFLNMEFLPVLGVGFLVSFLTALWAVKIFVDYIAKHSFRIFAGYRILFAVVILLTAYFGWVSWEVV